MDIKTRIDQFLGKNTNIKETRMPNGDTEVCDLDTGDCYTISVKDGLIERVDNDRINNRTVNIRTPQGGIKTLLND